MTYPEVLANARECIGKYCKACPVCNGVACKNQIPGPGAKGVGDTAIRNYNKWAEIRVNMDTLCENGTPDTGVELFGKTFKYPFFAGPVGAVNLHYSDTYTDMTYNDVLVRACAENGIPFADNTEICQTYADLWQPDGIHVRPEFYPYWAANLILAGLDSPAEAEDATNETENDPA